MDAERLTDLLLHVFTVTFFTALVVVFMAFLDKENRMELVLTQKQYIWYASTGVILGILAALGILVCLVLSIWNLVLSIRTHEPFT